MGIEFKTSLELDLLYARWIGFITFEEFQANFARYLDDVNYRPGRPELVDLSEMTGTDVNFSLVSSMLRQVNSQVPDQLVSTHTVIVAPNETIYGIGRMYQSLAEQAGGIRVDLFSDEISAIAALGFEQRTIEDLLASTPFLAARPKGS